MYGEGKLGFLTGNVLVHTRGQKSFAETGSISSFLLPLKFFDCFYTWSEEDKTVHRSFDVIVTKDDKSDVEPGSLRCL